MNERPNEDQIEFLLRKADAQPTRRYYERMSKAAWQRKETPMNFTKRLTFATFVLLALFSLSLLSPTVRTAAADAVGRVVAGITFVEQSPEPLTTDKPDPLTANEEGCDIVPWGYVDPGQTPIDYGFKMPTYLPDTSTPFLDSAGGCNHISTLEKSGDMMYLQWGDEEYGYYDSFIAGWRTERNEFLTLFVRDYLGGWSVPEGTELEAVQLDNGIEAALSKRMPIIGMSFHNISLAWNDGDFQYQISSDELSREELIAIAESFD